jgi:hypothetical protein
MLFMVTALLFEILSAEVTCGPIGLTGYVRTMTIRKGRAEEKFPEFEESPL